MDIFNYTSGINANSLGINPYLLILLIIWTLAWKGVALWKSARLNKPIWFVILLILNTFGILEILYIFIFSNLSASKEKQNTPNKGRKRR